MNHILDRERIEFLIESKLKYTFLIFSLALITTLSFSILVISSNEFMNLVYSYRYMLIMSELMLALALSFGIFKFSKLKLLTMLFLYSALSGITLSSIFFIYSIKSIVTVLVSTIVLFIILAIYGYITKNNLSSFSSILTGGLISILVLTLVNIFLKNSLLNIFLSFLAVFIFMIFIAYDVNKIKENILINARSKDLEILDKIAIIGAFSLYLDFINLFINLLKLFGSSKD